MPSTEHTDGTETPATEEKDSQSSQKAENKKEPEQETYTYTDMSKTMYVKSEVNVRDLPDKNGKLLGKLSAKKEVKVTGQCNETKWYRIQYNNGTAYVSNSYLTEEKPAEKNRVQVQVRNLHHLQLRIKQTMH